MGHLRTGTLPTRSKTWQAVVSSVGSFAGGWVSERNIADIANKTLEASSQKLRELPQDESTRNCFRFLVTLAVAGQSSDVRIAIHKLGINIEDEPTKLQLSKALREWLSRQVRRNYNPEIESISRKATVDTIAAWLNKSTEKAQLDFFSGEADLFQPWREASDGHGFCELSRIFFAHFTSRYLKYFLSRTASAQLRTISDREHFEAAIDSSVDNISQHAFETSRLVQSFAAGWFNKYANKKIPPTGKIEGFLRHAFEKIREELRREKVA